MRFAHPYLLLLLMAVPLLTWWRIRRRRRGLVPFSDASIAAALPTTWRIRLQPLSPTLFALGATCLIVALARPQRGLDESIVRTEGVDIVLALDLSQSMDTRDFFKLHRRISRLEAAQNVIKRFLGKRPNDRIGIVGFASLPYAIAPLTLDHAWLIQRLEGLNTGMLDGRRTAIGDGIASAVNRLRESKAKSKVVILLTDGANNSGLSPESASRAAAALGIKIYTIGAGGGRPDSLFSQPLGIDEDSLKRIAKITGGKFYRARDLSSLDAVYDEIDRLEKSEIKVTQYVRFEETAKGWIVAGLLLLAFEQLLSLSKPGRLP